MDLTPNDIRNYEFPSQLRGYDKDAVDEFCEKVAQAMEAVKQETVKTSMELESIKGQLDGLKQFEDAIKSAAIDARKNADQTVNAAKKEAENILTAAREQAEQTIKNNENRLQAINQQLERLSATRQSYLEQLQEMMNSHLAMVDAIEKNEALAISSDENIDVTDSSEVDGRLKETLANTDEAVPDDQVSEKNELSDSSEVEAQAQAQEEVANQVSNDVTDTEKLKQVLADNAPVEQAIESKEIDPELAAALQNYKKDVADDQTQQNAQTAQAETPPTAPVPPAPKQGEVVETTARAEDVPEGFIPTSEEPAIEENSVNLDTTGVPADPNLNLSNELDNVVAKFEEEMDKAAKN